MGMMKSHLDDYDDAKDVLIKIGALKTCEFHEDYWYDTGKFYGGELYACATNYLKEHSADYPFIDMKSFHAAVDKVMKDAGPDSTCPRCKKIDEE